MRNPKERFNFLNTKPPWPVCPSWLNQVISRKIEQDFFFFTVYVGYLSC